MDTGWNTLRVHKPCLFRPDKKIVMSDSEREYVQAVSDKLTGYDLSSTTDLVVRLTNDQRVTDLVDFSTDFKDLLDRVNHDLPLTPLSSKVASWLSCSVFPAVRYYLPDYGVDFPLRDALEVMGVIFVDVSMVGFGSSLLSLAVNNGVNPIEIINNISPITSIGDEISVSDDSKLKVLVKFFSSNHKTACGIMVVSTLLGVGVRYVDILKLMKIIFPPVVEKSVLEKGVDFLQKLLEN